jgi:hypothetical protein
MTSRYFHHRVTFQDGSLFDNYTLAIDGQEEPHYDLITAADTAISRKTKIETVEYIGMVER